MIISFYIGIANLFNGYSVLCFCMAMLFELGIDNLLYTTEVCTIVLKMFWFPFSSTVGKSNVIGL